eukprot:13806568-Ditylum_brightwellii.AAC.1
MTLKKNTSTMPVFMEGSKSLCFRYLLSIQLCIVGGVGEFSVLLEKCRIQSHDKGTGACKI